jgi:ABC-2 type transport system ATP-binding protein
MINTIFGKTMNGKYKNPNNSQDSDIRVKITNLQKGFKIYDEQVNTLKGFFQDPRKLKAKNFHTHVALKNINLTVRNGEMLGIIGRNGSGKSTLLKIIAGIYAPDSGEVTVNGRIVPFLELGVGFNQDLSARENVFLNGTILGMTRDEIKHVFDEIIDFAELKEFTETPVKKFSSGMLVRLAFSIAMQAKGDLYILDEILSVGDYNFQVKSIKQFEKLRENNKTILFVSHSLSSIEKYCDRVVWIKDGELIERDNKQQIINEYLEYSKNLA